MNKLALQGVQDFALTTDALAFMQSAFESFEQLGNLGGESIIVSGCVVTGSSVSSGWMFIKGKLMPFIGGSIQTNVRIVETVQTVNVDVASRQQTTYYAEFGTSSDPLKNVAWSNITRFKNLKELAVIVEEHEQEISAIMAPPTTIALDPIEVNGYSLPDSTYGISIMKDNRTIVLSGKVRANATNQYQAISYIPSGFWPARDMPMAVFTASGTLLKGYVSYQTGFIWVDAAISNNDIIFGASWIK